MKTASSAPYLALSGLIALLAALFLLEWRTARADLKELSSQVASGMRQMDRRLELESGRSAAAFRSLEMTLERLRDKLRESRSVEVSRAAVAEPDPANPEPAQYLEEEARPLPSLPAGTDPLAAVKLTPEEILKDPRFNPSGRELTGTEVFRIAAALTRGRATGEILESEVRAKMKEALDELRPEGDYVEYAPGEAYEKVEGAITVAEPAAGGRIRMYYLLPEAFQEIHDLRLQKAMEAERALQEVLSIVDGGGLATDNGSPEGGG